MIEELKIIAEMMNGITNGAVAIAVMYLILQYLKIPTIILAFGYAISKVIKHFKIENVEKVERVNND